MASGENWLLFTKTLGEIQIQEIVEAEPNCLDRLCTFSGEILERVGKESSEARIGCEKTLKNNTGPFFSWGLHHPGVFTILLRISLDILGNSFASCVSSCISAVAFPRSI